MHNYTLMFSSLALLLTFLIGASLLTGFNVAILKLGKFQTINHSLYIAHPDFPGGDHDGYPGTQGKYPACFYARIAAITGICRYHCHV